MRYYSQTTGCTYLPETHGDAMPDDAVIISNEHYLAVIASPHEGKVRAHDADGLPILIDAPAIAITVEGLCEAIDKTADDARRAVAGDPLRAVEYDRARIEAQAFADAGYPADAVPRTVAAWAINGRTPAEAAESILAEAAAYTNALYSLREIRLRAKADILIRMAAGETEEAQSIAHEATAAIEAAVAGIGNA
ncbi:phage tail protein [Pseudomonas stutzeri]|nr:phage tail protein [Stutzerimonas stutzeri]